MKKGQTYNDDTEGNNQKNLPHYETMYQKRYCTENLNENYVWLVENEVYLFKLDLPAFTVKNSVCEHATFCNQ
jgi:hypothetical protein